MIALGAMEGTISDHRSESLWIMAPGLDTLASASADSEPVPAGDSGDKRSRKRNAAYDDLFVNVSPRRSHETDKSGLLDVLAAVLSPSSVKLEGAPFAPVGAVIGRKQGQSARGKARAKSRGAPKAQHPKQKTPAATQSSSYATKNHLKTDTDSSDCDDTPRNAPSSMSASSLMVSAGGEGEAHSAVVPPRALTVRERHRECNRLVARKTRVKKKIELDLLTSSFNDCRASNNSMLSLLRAVVTREIKSRILLDCDFQLPDNVVTIAAEMLAARECQQYVAMGRVEASVPVRSFCITNPTVADNPIAYASKDFGDLTGYDPQTIVGYNCRFLQGEGSDPREVRRLKVAIEKGRSEQVVLKNYRRNGTAFWNLIHVVPILDPSGKVVLIVGSHSEVYQLFTSSGEEMFSTGRTFDSRQSPSSSSCSVGVAAVDAGMDGEGDFEGEGEEEGFHSQLWAPSLSPSLSHTLSHTLNTHSTQRHASSFHSSAPHMSHLEEHRDGRDMDHREGPHHTHNHTHNSQHTQHTHNSHNTQHTHNSQHTQHTHNSQHTQHTHNSHSAHKNKPIHCS